MLRSLDLPSRRPSKSPRPPLRNFAECAEMLGLTSTQLSRLKSYHGGFPAVQIKRTHSSRSDYFNPREVRDWFQALTPAVPATIETEKS